ncbi:hypothetical protein H2198_004656 [Neophaeococcomyces mojaviensis]|uniref:Uncharacterized protein n=1 Tax=Neophaeococcomyces mojaviensis TaxID=3383035 RepID=A0ACC3A887_9EURO|nr:hypothetical protein H2198_004656 [Knufia sp. JES_112]
MSTLPSPSLIQQAQAILKAATSLQNQLDQHGLPQPGFEASSPQDWHHALDHEDILKTRSALIDASQVMLNLALGPIDTLIHAAPTRLEVLRTLDALGVAQAVPIDGPISVTDLAAKVKVNAGLLYRQLKFAYLMGFFHEPVDKPGWVAHTAFSAAMPRFSPYTQLRYSRLFYSGAWEVANALKVWEEPAPEGHVQVPVELADPKHRGMWKILEEDYDPDGKGHEKFAAGMKALVAAHSGSSFAQYIRGFDWAALGHGKGGLVVDVGGGNGHIEANIVKDLPQNIKFIIQDLAANETAANQLIKQHEAQDRIGFHVHDFFQPQPPNLHPVAYILSRVLHDWQDEDAVKIIKPMIPAMEQGAKLFVSERILPDQMGEIPVHREEALRTIDILMFTLFGAKERTQQDWTRLFASVDHRLRVQVVRHPPASVFSMMEVVLDT